MRSYDTHFRMNPPLRPDAARMACIEGLVDGTIDCIATDHAPHADWEKAAEFDAAPFGTTGLETALGVCVETLVVPGLLSWAQLIEKFASAPARIAGIDAGTLRVGAEANVALIDPRAQWTVEPSLFASMGHHSPFAGQTLTGVVRHVLRRGAPVNL